MKIIQINGAYKEGSTGQIVSNIHDGIIFSGNESVVCYGRGKIFEEPNVYKTSSELQAKIGTLFGRITGYQYGGCLFSTNRILKIIKYERPDIVHIHCINGRTVNIYRLFRWLKEKEIKTIVTLHAEFFFTGSCGHSFECEKWMQGCGNCPQKWKATKSYFFDTSHQAWKRMRDTFSDFDCNNIIFSSVSPWLAQRAKRSTILGTKQHIVIKNGVNVDVFHPVDISTLKSKLNIDNKKVILFVTPNFSLDNDSLKGGYYVVELAKKLQSNDFIIIVIGGRGGEANLPPNVLSIGRVEDQCEMATYYSLANLSIIASKRETFSMVCVESLCCGTPVVGFQAGGPESIALEKYTEFVEYGDINALESAIVRWINYKTIGTALPISTLAATEYSKEIMIASYLQLYENLSGMNSKRP